MRGLLGVLGVVLTLVRWSSAAWAQDVKKLGPCDSAEDEGYVYGDDPTPLGLFYNTASESDYSVRGSLAFNMVSAYNWGRFDRALRSARDLLALHRKCGWKTHTVMHDMGVVLLEFGNYAAAEQHFDKMAAVRKKEQQRLAKQRRSADPVLLNSRGLLARHRGRLGMAKRYFTRAQAAGRSAEARLVTSTNLGIVLLELGDLKAARRQFQQSKELVPHVGGFHSGSLARKLYEAQIDVNVALVDLREGQLGQARKRLQALTKLVGGRRLAGVYNNLAQVERASGRVDAAVEAVEKALEVLRRELRAPHPALANMVHTLAQAQRARGDFDAAQSSYSEALTEAEAALGARHPLVSMILANQALAFRARGQPQEAVRALTRAYEIDEQSIVEVLPAATEVERRSYLSLVRDHLDQVVAQHFSAASPESLALATRGILARKGRSLDVEVSRRKLDPKELELRRTFAQLVFRAKAASAQSKRLEKLRAQLDTRAAAATLRPLPRDLPVRVAGALPRQTLLLELYQYQVFDDRSGKPRELRYGALRLTASDEPELVDIGPAAPIDAAVVKLRRALQSPEGDFAAPARALRDALAAALSIPPGTKQLLVAADGALNLVPFEVLPGERTRFLVEETAVGYLTSGRDLLGESGSKPGNGRVRALADPVMANPKWSELPGTREEAEDIGDLFPRSEVLLGEAATRKALIASAEAQPQVLHVATHGFFLPRGKTRVDDAATLAVRGLELEPAPRPSQPPADPLSRAGLILSPTKQGDNGVVSALELAAIDLRQTQLVVLSACETGLGDVEPGQGVYGLRRALALAGAEQQVVSLWKVDDDATQELMSAFYGRIAGGDPPQRALRNAKLALLQKSKTSHPYYWAAFIGSGRPLPVSEVTLPSPAIVQPRGCGCAMLGRSTGDGFAWLGLPLLALLRRRRRKSRDRTWSHRAAICL